MELIAQWYRQVAGNMDWGNALNVLMAYKLVFVVMLLGYISHWLPYRTKDCIAELYGRSHISIKVMAAVFTGVLCYQAYSASFQPFIYFQF